MFVSFTATATTYVLVYVDDILITGSNSTAISSLITTLNSTFALKDLGKLHYFLGIEAHSLQTGGLHLTQSKYVSDLLKKANMADAKPMPSPMISGQKLSSTDGSPFRDPVLYRSIVGALQYATITRPDISFSVNKVCQFMHNPLDTHWKTVKRILRYLSGTSSFGLHIKPSSNFHLSAFCDSDWGSDPNDRKSTSGLCVFLGGNLISWSSKKQPVVSRSSTEAEYRCLACTITELMWLRSLLSELRVSLLQVPTVYCDNLSVVLLTANPLFHSRTKHFELDLHFVREKVVNKVVSVTHIPATSQIADGLTKAISNTSFSEFRTKLRVSDSSTTVLEGG
ncbi:uncharacterized mitochondrial protein AtMg00810-like [Gastrolobium bilobum]|uniref:uncharacterized mitochondrial protein AtMg00810-like n=1 Tax=Gastrolobium bilobum TaxID=150636 RepID=UPI002AAF8DD6|nr:uncharacterized mitochondrial protein AtMg00810-like [Gastrolobium bilobum]